MDKLDEVIFKHLQNTSLDFFNWCIEKGIRKDSVHDLYYCITDKKDDFPNNFVRVSGDVIFNRFVMETFVRNKKPKDD